MIAQKSTRARCPTRRLPSSPRKNAICRSERNNPQSSVATRHQPIDERARAAACPSDRFKRPEKIAERVAQHERAPEPQPYCVFVPAQPVFFERGLQHREELCRSMEKQTSREVRASSQHDPGTRRQGRCRRASRNVRGLDRGLKTSFPGTEGRRKHVQRPCIRKSNRGDPAGLRSSASPGGARQRPIDSGPWQIKLFKKKRFAAHAITDCVARGHIAPQSSRKCTPCEPFVRFIRGVDGPLVAFRDRSRRLNGHAASCVPTTTR